MIDKNAGYGQYGGRVIKTTSATTANASGYFYAVQFTGTAVVTTQVDYDTTPNPWLAELTAGFTAGTIVYGKFKSITLTSGTAIGYYATE
jgi:hypothetical protein